MKLSKLKKGDIAIIEWVDSYSTTRWLTKDEAKHWIKTLIPCVSMGIVLEIDNTFVTLYSDKAPDEIGRIMSIPKNAIQDIKLLK